MKIFAACSLAVAVVSALHCTPVSAAGETAAAVFSLEPSVRFSGMGNSSNAVSWGIDPDYWSNPALLGHYHGIHFDHGRTQLIPVLDDDIYFTTDRIAVGEWGAGIVMVDRPIGGLGKARLDYGTWYETDAGGDVIATHESYENMKVCGVGIRVLEVTENILRNIGSSPPQLSRFADLSIGLSSKNADVVFVPASETGGEGVAGKVTTHDYGLLLELTPYNSISQSGFLPALDRIFDAFGGIQVGVAYGRSMQNCDEKEIKWAAVEEASPVAKVARHGWAVQGAIGFPRPVRRACDSHGLGMVAQSLTPLISAGMAWDWRRTVWPSREPTAETSGWEITLGNIYSIRRGRIDDPDGMVHGDTHGWGLGLKIADLAGFRYDSASVPLGEGVARRERSGYTFFLDPIRIYRHIKVHPARTVLR
jgi:hypothetical protein